MPNNLFIPPNIPLHVALVDPEGIYDFDLNVGRYETTTGQSLTLPRSAVVLLNMLEPRPGEELVITKHWKGASAEWTVALSHASECARAGAGEGDRLTRQLESSIEAISAPQAIVALRKPAKREIPEVSPRGNGTTGPAAILLPAVLPRKLPPVQIPANIAVREILSFIQDDPNTANWSDQAKQDLGSTVYIAAVKAGHVGLWERP